MTRIIPKIMTDSYQSTEISRLTMTGEQGTLDSSLGGHYMNKASNYGPAVFKTAELVRKKN